MALVDYRILQQNSGSMIGAGLEGLERGQQANDANRQRRLQAEQQKLAEQERIRQQSFQQNLNGLLGSYGEYAHTPEGQRGLFADMAKAGFGREMMGLMGGMPEVPKPQQARPQTWHNAGNGAIFNDATGDFKSAPSAPVAPTKPSQPASLDLAKARFEEQKRMNDARIAAMKRPKPTTPKPPSPVKALSGDAAKLLSISWTMQDDISAMNKAFKEDFAGSIAGIKSGTNKRLLDLADQIADKVGRLRSGGAVNKDEEARFMRLIATLRGAAFSNAKEAEETLNGLAREGSIVMEGIDPDGKHRERIKAAQAPAAPAQKFTKPEEEDEYQAWKKSQGIR